jgi:uncharacterized membrane protein
MDFPVRWSWGRVAATFVAVFWLIPAVIAFVATGLAGDCEGLFTSENCSAVEDAASDTAFLMAIFLVVVSGPLTALVGVWWLVRLLVRWLTRHDEASESSSGLRESYVRGFAVILWWFIIGGVAGAILTGEGAWLWIAIGPGIVAVPLTLILTVDWHKRRKSRQTGQEGGTPQRVPLAWWPDAGYMLGIPIIVGIVGFFAVVIFRGGGEEEEPRVVTLSVSSTPRGLPFTGEVGATGSVKEIVGIAPATYDIPRERGKGVTVTVEGDSSGDGVLMIEVDCGDGYWKSQWIGESGKARLDCPAFD